MNNCRWDIQSRVWLDAKLKFIQKSIDFPWVNSKRISVIFTYMYWNSPSYSELIKCFRNEITKREGGASLEIAVLINGTGELNFNLANILPLSGVHKELTLALFWGAWLGCFLLQGCHSPSLGALSLSHRGGAPRLWGKVWLKPGARASRRWLQGGWRRQEEEEETVPAG